MNPESKLAQLIRSTLRALSASNADIESSALISLDGLVMATVLQPGVDADRFGAMCASLLALAERATSEINRGNLRQTLVEGDAGSMLLVHVGDEAVLALAAKPTMNLGRVFLDAKKTAAKLGELLALRHP